MAHTYAIVGAGRQGRAAALDLARHGEAGEIRLLERDGARLDEALRWLAARVAVPVRGLRVDAADVARVRAALAGSDAALSCAPYFLNADLAAAAVAEGVHFNDLGGNTAVVDRELALDGEARRRGVSVVPDCGLAPGLVNQLAAAGIGRLDEVEAVRLYCGGLPQHPRPPMNYAISFSIHGLINEYTGTAEVLRDGRLARVPALSEVEAVEWPGLGPLEAFVTTGGTSTAPRTFAGRVGRYDYKTLRYPGHVAQLRLLDALGLFGLDPVEVDGAAVVPRHLFAAVAEPALSDPGFRDLILVRAVIEGRRGGRPRRIVFELEDRYDEVEGLSAMERATAFPAAVVTAMAARGELPAGALPLERAVDPERALREVRRRGLDLREREEG